MRYIGQNTFFFVDFIFLFLSLEQNSATATSDWVFLDRRIFITVVPLENRKWLVMICGTYGYQTLNEETTGILLFYFMLMDSLISIYIKVWCSQEQKIRPKTVQVRTGEALIVLKRPWSHRNQSYGDVFESCNDAPRKTSEDWSHEVVKIQWTGSVHANQHVLRCVLQNLYLTALKTFW